MIYGLVGASGTGKTTLGNIVAESLNLQFVPTSITECARKHGYDAVGTLTLADRLDLQRHLLHDHVELITTCNRPAITDRTPIDMIGYLMCEFYMQSSKDCNDEIMQGAERYVQDCLDAVSTHYDQIFHLGKLSTYEVDPKRPPANPAYGRHFDLTVKGALIDLRGGCKYTIVAGEQLDFRVDVVETAIQRRLDLHEVDRKKNKALH